MIVFYSGIWTSDPVIYRCQELSLATAVTMVLTTLIKKLMATRDETAVAVDSAVLALEPVMQSSASVTLSTLFYR